MRSLALSSGHGKLIRGASGYLDEVDEARRVVDRVVELLRDAKAGVTVAAFHDDVSKSQNENLNRIVEWHNKQSRELDVSVHLNAYKTTSSPMGTEVLYVTQSRLASDISAAIAKAGPFINRGAKKRTDLRFLNSTDKPALLLEICFVDSRTDADLYKVRFEAICKAIAEEIGDVNLDNSAEPAPPVESPPPVETTPSGPSNHNMVDVGVTVESGDVAVTVNGQLLSGRFDSKNTVALVLTVTGDVVTTVNGQDFQIDMEPDSSPDGPSPPPPEAPEGWIEDIETTVFGGANDPNDSAYPPYSYIDDQVLGAAVPYKFPGIRPRLKVRNRANGMEVIVGILDVGPWMIDDEAYVMGGERPVAEICFNAKTPLPRGPHKGTVPSNGAGLDLTPAAAKAIDLKGKGWCDWMLYEVGV